MSCWRNYTCDVLKNVKKECIFKALEEMGLNYTQDKNKFNTRLNKCDCALIKNGRAIPVGIMFKDDTGHARVIGDFWGTGIDEKTFVDELSQLYQKIDRIAMLEMQGWTVDSVETNAEGEIEIEAYCS